MSRERLQISFPIDRWAPRRGGLERYLDRLTRSLAVRGHRITILCRERDGTSTTESDAVPGRSVQVLEVPWVPAWRGEVEFARRASLLHEESGRDLLFCVRHPWTADVYQPHGGSFVAARAAAHASLPGARGLLHRSLAALRPRIHALSGLERALFERSPHVRVISLSRKVEEDFRAVFPERELSFERIPNGIDTGEFHDKDRVAASHQLRSLWGIPATARIAAFVAHLFRPKGLHHAIAGVAETRGWHLAVGGRGRPAPYVRLARRLRVRDRIHFLGELPATRELLAAADALVLPSYYDPCSLATLEALACGVPVITTRHNGASELLTPGRDGLVLERPDSPAEIGSALGRIAAEWERFHAAALALRPEIAWPRHVDRIETVLRRAARERAGIPS